MRVGPRQLGEQRRCVGRQGALRTEGRLDACGERGASGRRRREERHPRHEQIEGAAERDDVVIYALQPDLDILQGGRAGLAVGGGDCRGDRRLRCREVRFGERDDRLAPSAGIVARAVHPRVERGNGGIGGRQLQRPEGVDQLADRVGEAVPPLAGEDGEAATSAHAWRSKTRLTARLPLSTVET